MSPVCHENITQTFRKLRIGYLEEQNNYSPIASVQRTRSILASHSAVPRGTMLHE